MVMLRLVSVCEPGMSDQEAGLTTLTELDCAYQPKYAPGQVSLRTSPLTLQVMFVGVVGTDDATRKLPAPCRYIGSVVLL